MARGRSSRSSPRDGYTIASEAVDASFYEDLTEAPSFRVFEDLRTWHPAGRLRAVQSYTYGDGLLVDRSNVRVGRTEAPLFSGHVGFREPDRVFICARRKQRREVLMATGRGGGRHSRKPRRNRWSDVRC